MKSIRSWIDPTTRREVHQLTNCPNGAMLDYFRLRKHLADGRILALARKNAGSEVLAIDTNTGEVEPLPVSLDGAMTNLQVGGQRLWMFRGDRQIWSVDLPHGRPQRAARLPDDVPGYVETISCDGRIAWIRDLTQDLRATPTPTSGDPEYYWKFMNRPRTGRIWAFDLHTGLATRALTTEGVCPNHFDASPTDPNLVRFCLDIFEPRGQRVWCVRADGSGHCKVREQASGEMVTHEFWWPDGKSVGYTYQDRRGETNPEHIPLAEYAPSPTRLGIADTKGREIYLSDPLNCYHSHLYVSPDARFVSGEGTHDHQFVYAAPFSFDNPRIDFQPLAALHTPYVAFRGQNVEANFSADSKWLLFNDTIDGQFQVCAVRV